MRTDELIAAYGRQGREAGGRHKKIGIIRLLEGDAGEEALSFLLRVLADEAEYDLARVEVAKILELRETRGDGERGRIAEALKLVLDASGDELVKQYAAMAAEYYADAGGLFEALARRVHDPGEDVNVRWNALAAIEGEGPTPRAAGLLTGLLGDPEFGPEAARVLRQWQADEDRGAGESLNHGEKS